MPKANDRIGPYRLINKLGAGGFGEFTFRPALATTP